MFSHNEEFKRKRLYRTLASLILIWTAHGYQMLRVDLTSAVGADYSKLRSRYKQLRRKIESEFDYPGIENFIIETSEGNGVLHMILAWKDKSLINPRKFYIPKQWLSDEWSKLHEGSIIVYVAKYENGETSRKRLSRYLVSQYMANHSSALVRYSYSWGRSLGVPLGKTWNLFKYHHFNFLGLKVDTLIDRWESFLMGETLEGRFNKMLRVVDLKHEEVFY